MVAVQAGQGGDAPATVCREGKELPSPGNVDGREGSLGLEKRKFAVLTASIARRKASPGLAEG
jgi:hypothetical protein